jgi:hypothetical protein
MEQLLPLFARGSVRVVFSGHEHNFQHSSHNHVDYFVTGAGSKVRKGSPRWFEQAHTRSWADAAHFLLVTVDQSSMKVEPMGELVDGDIQRLTRFDPNGVPISDQIVVDR